MKILIIYYSHTGNNRSLAGATAERLGAETFEIEEIGPRTNKRIILDMILHRYPRIKVLPERVSEYDLVIFFGPVWMFGIASPLRSCFKSVRNSIKKYAFVTLSGGALGPNTKISGELVRRLGKNQAFLLDLNITNFLTGEENPDAETTSGIRLNGGSEEQEGLVSVIAGTVNALKL